MPDATTSVPPQKALRGPCCLAGALALSLGLSLSVQASAGAGVVRRQLNREGNANGSGDPTARRALAPAARAPGPATKATTRARGVSASATSEARRQMAFVATRHQTFVAADTSPAQAGLRLEGAEVALGVGAGVLWRSLSFSQDVYHRMRTQDVSATVYRVEGAVFPLLRGLPASGHVGLVAGYEGTLSGSVQDANFDAEYDIRYSELFGGLRVRGDIRQQTLGFNLTLNRLESGLDDEGLAGVPDITYTQLRTALDVLFTLGPVRATAAAGFRMPLSYGEISDATWFPRVGGYGVDVALGASYPIVSRLSVELAGSFRHFLLEMNASPEDALDGIAEVASGANDSYLGAYLGLSFNL